MASATLRNIYQSVRRSPIAHCVSPSIPFAMSCATTLAKWAALEECGLVRLRAEIDEFPDDPSEGESWGSIGEYRLDPDSDRWTQGGSVWGHVGYRDVLDWRENIYIFDIMTETINAFRSAHKEYVHNVCPCCHGTGKAR